MIKIYNMNYSTSQFSNSKNHCFLLYTSFSFLILLFTLLSPSVLAQGELVFKSRFGTMGAGNGQFDSPAEIAIASNGDIWVVESSNRRVQRFDNNGNYISQFGSSGIGNGEFSFPYGIVIDSNGDLLITDGNGNRVQRFDSNGNYLSQFGSSGAGAGQLDTPYGIAIAINGDILVADGDNDRIQRFANDGSYIGQIGSSGSGNGQLDIPWGLVVAANGDILVADRDNHRIQRFDNDGNYISQFGTMGVGNGQFNRPTGIVIAANGDILVLDYSNQRIQRFDNNGNYLSQFGSLGVGDGEFFNPFGIAIDVNAPFDIFVSNFDGHNVQRFTLVTVPTLSEWGLIVLALLILNIGLLHVTAPKIQLANGQSVSTSLNIRQLPFDKSIYLKMLLFASFGIFAIFFGAIFFFDYELTKADPFGSVIAVLLIGYLGMLLKRENK